MTTTECTSQGDRRDPLRAAWTLLCFTGRFAFLFV